MEYYYDKSQECIFIVHEIQYTSQVDNKGKLNDHYYYANVDVIHKNISVVEGLASKKTSHNPSASYDAKTTGKVDAEGYFVQKIKRDILRDSQKITEGECMAIVHNWKEGK